MPTAHDIERAEKAAELVASGQTIYAAAKACDYSDASSATRAITAHLRRKAAALKAAEATL